MFVCADDLERVCKEMNVDFDEFCSRLGCSAVKKVENPESHQMTFGMYKGLTVAEVYKERANYLTNFILNSSRYPEIKSKFPDDYAAAYWYVATRE